MRGSHGHRHTGVSAVVISQCTYPSRHPSNNNKAPEEVIRQKQDEKYA